MALKISTEEYDLIADFVYSISGNSLGNSKGYLMESRLGPIAQKNNCDSYFDLYQLAKRNSQIRDAIISAMTTNETSFFRDEKVFDMLKNCLIPGVFEKQTDINIWSAACSYGQEVYTLAMILKETIFDMSKFKIQILGTDISDNAIAYSSYATYSSYEVNRGLTPRRISQHFQVHEDRYKIRDELRGMVTIRKMNLMERLPFFQRFDIVLCRNILIYFNNEDKKAIYEKLATSLKLGGILVIGSTEMLQGLTERFEKKNFRGIIYYQKIK